MDQSRPSVTHVGMSGDGDTCSSCGMSGQDVTQRTLRVLLSASNPVTSGGLGWTMRDSKNFGLGGDPELGESRREIRGLVETVDGPESPLGLMNASCYRISPSLSAKVRCSRAQRCANQHLSLGPSEPRTRTSKMNGWHFSMNETSPITASR